MGHLTTKKDKAHASMWLAILSLMVAGLVMWFAGLGLTGIPLGIVMVAGVHGLAQLFRWRTMSK